MIDFLSLAIVSNFLEVWKLKFGSYWKLKLKIEVGSWKWKLLEIESWKLEVEVIGSWKLKFEIWSLKLKF